MVDSRLSLDWFCSLVGQSEYSPPRQIRADPRQVTLIICLFRVTQSWPNIMGRGALPFKHEADGRQGMTSY